MRTRGASGRWLSIRQRLLLSLGLLAMATILVGVLSWHALDRADAKLEALHRQTLNEVTRALNLSRRSSDLVASAPFLLGLRSPYLIRSEGIDLIAEIDELSRQWADGGGRGSFSSRNGEESVSRTLNGMKTALLDLMRAADMLDAQRDRTIRYRARLRQLERLFSRKTNDPFQPAEERHAWLTLQKAANALIGAAYVDSLPGLGEYNRQFSRHARSFLVSSASNGPLRKYLDEMQTIATGPQSLFAVRRRELDQNIFAQGALFHIRHQSRLISEMATRQAKASEALLSKRRRETATAIGIAKLTILTVGLGSALLALFSALYVSGYVTGNIRAISAAMERLARGDRSTALPRPRGGMDEIDKLLQAFRVFRANALRLDRSNRQLKRRNLLFERIFENITDGVAILDETGRITAANPCLKKVLRLPEDAEPLKVADIRELLARSPFAEDARRFALGQQFRPRTELHSPNGDVVEVRASQLPDGGEVWLFSDSTERHRIEERLGQIRRIEALGKVTGEVAHDFGNILGTISSNLHLLETRSPEKDTSAIRQRIANALEIGSSLTHRLLAFARKQRLTPELTELNALVQGLEDLVAIGLKEGIRLRITPSDEPLHACIDPGQLESAILNLCLNSNQAIEGGGEIRITLRKGREGMAVIEISDTGCGMDAPVLQRAMEPFFTTRSDGSGTGLGLSSVYGFITQSGGDFHIESTPGEGTTVRFSLPLVRSGPPAGAGDAGATAEPMRILLTEDEPDAMAHTARILGTLGHEVAEAQTCEEALRMLDGEEPFDALVTDIHLDGGRSGWDIVRRALSCSPPPLIIVTSGRATARQIKASGYCEDVIFLPKPLTAEALQEALHRRARSEASARP